MHLVVSKLRVGFLSSLTAFHIHSHKEWDCEKTHFTSGMFDDIFLTKILPPFSRPISQLDFFFFLKSSTESSMLIFSTANVFSLGILKRQLPPVHNFNAYYVPSYAECFMLIISFNPQNNCSFSGSF